MTVDKTALIIAGGSGMGADAARRLAQDGFRIAILSSSGKGKALAEELGGIGVTGSNRSNEDIERLVDGAMAAWGRIDAVVNSAGHVANAPVLDIADEDWHEGLEVFLLNVVRATRLVTPIMRAQGGGAIVNISTFHALEPDVSSPISGIFRAGLANFAKQFADSHAADNIRMNNVLPGFIDSLPEREDRLVRIPMGRYGRMAEISSLISWLVSEGGGYMTGQNLRVDGGVTRGVWPHCAAATLHWHSTAERPERAIHGLPPPPRSGVVCRSEKDRHRGGSHERRNPAELRPGSSL